MIEDVQLVDLRTRAKASDSVAILYFHQLQGSIHIYRDGVVILTSPGKTITVSLAQADETRYRRTEFLRLLTHLGATDDDLVEADVQIGQQDSQLSQLSFAESIHKATVASEIHMQKWCQRRGLNYETMAEDDIDQVVDEAVAQVRNR